MPYKNYKRASDEGRLEMEQRLRQMLMRLQQGITGPAIVDPRQEGYHSITPLSMIVGGPGDAKPMIGGRVAFTSGIDSPSGLTPNQIEKWAEGARHIPRARIAGSSLEGGMSDLYKETSEPYRELDDWRNSQNPLSVVQGKDVNSMAEQTRPPEQQAGDDGQSLQAILGQDEYNPASGMTYQEWLEWKLANSGSLEALGKITGARMPRMGQRR